MLFRDVIQLVGSDSTTTNEMSDVIPVPATPRMVFANQKSIRQSEFYQAAAAGLKPQVMFEVRSVDYQGEKTLVFEGTNYKIIRVYSKNGEISELICEGPSV